MINARHFDAGRIAGAQSSGQGLDGLVEIEEQSARHVVTNHALHPKKRGDALTACDAFDKMKTRRRIKHEIACGKFHLLLPDPILNH